MRKNTSQLADVKTHGIASGVSLAALVFVSLAATGMASYTANLQRLAVEIGIEHTLPLGLSLEIAELNGVAQSEIHSDSNETIYLSIPSDWTKREVYGAAIEDVTANPPALGFTRWTLPPHAGISFRVPKSPTSMTLHNPSKVPIKLEIIRVTLPEETVEKNVILVHEEKKVLF